MGQITGTTLIFTFTIFYYLTLLTHISQINDYLYVIATSVLILICVFMTYKAKEQSYFVLVFILILSLMLFYMNSDLCT